MRARLLVLVVLAACQRTETVTRTVNLHLAGTCKIPGGSAGDYVATGDYDPPAQNHSAFLQTDAPSQPIDGIPENVASLALLANAPPDLASWQGVALVPSSGNLDMLLLPAASSCALATKVGFAPGMILGAVSAQTLVVSGGVVTNGVQPLSFRASLESGHVAALQTGIRKPRLRAPISQLGTTNGLSIVSGGVTASTPVLLANAEIYDDSAGDFTGDFVALTEPRADHASVTLVSGDVMLVGGANPKVMATTERIDAKTLHATESGMPFLTSARAKPYALRLADGSILVGGGVDDNSLPVSSVELFSPDLSTHTTQTVSIGPMNAFAALEGGGALLVTADATTPAQAWFIAPSTQPTQIATLGIVTDLKLFPHATGGALLWNGTAWLAFDPWTGQFSALATAPKTGPDVDSPITTSDPGMRAWVNDDGTLSLWRDTVRNAFASDENFLTTDTTLLAPDTIPAPSFDTQQGLTLVAGQSVFVSDSRYLDVDIDVTSAGASLPLVVLRSFAGEIEVGGASCPYPSSATVAAVHVVRAGPLVQFAAGGAFSTCATLDSSIRVAVGVRGGGATSRITALRVARSAR